MSLCLFLLKFHLSFLWSSSSRLHRTVPMGIHCTLAPCSMGMVSHHSSGKLDTLITTKSTITTWLLLLSSDMSILYQNQVLCALEDIILNLPFYSLTAILITPPSIQNWSLRYGLQHILLMLSLNSLEVLQPHFYMHNS